MPAMRAVSVSTTYGGLMKKYNYSKLIALFFGLLSSFALACSTFSFVSPEGPFVGKAYDWVVGHGALMINKRHIAKRALVFDEQSVPLQWVSKYASVTFNQHGLEFPVSGMNEKGLTIEVLWGEALHPHDGDGRPTINEIQWVQYQLDSFDTVDALLKRANDIRIEAVYADVHYFVCDAEHECATIEYLDGQLVTHTKQDLVVKVLTNDTYADSLDSLAHYKGFGGNKEIPDTASDSISRFVRLAQKTQNYDGQYPLGDAFDMLASVPKVIDGTVVGSDWNLVFDLFAKRVSYKTRNNPQIKNVSFKQFNLNCSTPAQMLDIDSPATGVVTNNFISFNEAANRSLIAQNWFLSEEVKQRAAEYPAQHTLCLKKY